jgi:hypothetical protein
MGKDTFTINQHYLKHLSYIIFQLGPLRLISARTLERSIQDVKRHIKSKQNPQKNSVTVLMDHYTKAYKNWQIGIESHSVDEDMVFKPSSADLINQLFPTCDIKHLIQQYLADHNGSSSTEEEYSVSTSNTYGKTRNGQTVDISSRKQNQKIVAYISDDTMSLQYNIGQAKQFIRWKDQILALLQHQTTLVFDGQTCCYYTQPYEERLLWKIIKAKDIIGYAILIPSLLNKDKTYVAWRPY